MQQAIRLIGDGLLTQPENGQLRARLVATELTAQEYYQQLLFLVYRLAILFVLEARALLPASHGIASALQRLHHYRSNTTDEGRDRTDLKSPVPIPFSVPCSRRLQQQKDTIDSAQIPGSNALWTLFIELDYALHPDGEQLRSFSIPTSSFLRHCQLSNTVCEAALHALLQPQGQPVDYTQLDSWEPGGYYEWFLTLHPHIDANASSFSLHASHNHERKISGSYYTPPDLVVCLLETTLEPVLQAACETAHPEQALLQIKVCDPACGSGYFLLAAAQRIAQRLAEVRSRTSQSAREIQRAALRDVITHCLYGVDDHPLAVEICRVHLWLEGLAPDLPLTPLQQHIRCGNSLLGARPALLEQGIPDQAFNVVDGDDPALCKTYQRQNKEARTQIDQPVSHHQMTPEQQQLLADAWCAAFVMPKSSQYISTIIDTHLFHQWLAAPETITPVVAQEVQRLVEHYRFFHWYLAFPDVFSLSTSNTAVEPPHQGWSGGFDVVLGNPPWERMRFQEKEWFTSRYPTIANCTHTSQRKRLIAALQAEKPELYAHYLVQRRKADASCHFVRNSGCYPLCGRKDINTYAVFTELMWQIVKPGGRMGCIVPSGIATDEHSKLLFQRLLTEHALVSLYDFENSANLFPDVDKRQKFCLLTCTGTPAPAIQASTFAFFLRTTHELQQAERQCTLSAQEIALINPHSLTCPIFRTQRDASLASSLYQRIPVLQHKGTGEAGDRWDARFGRMFDMTNDAALFRTRTMLEAEGWQQKQNIFYQHQQRYMPVFEGKMVDMYNHRAAHITVHQHNTVRPQQRLLSTEEHYRDPYFVTQPYLWAPEEVGRRRTSSHWQHNWFPVFKRVTLATNERTLIGCIMPWTTTSYTLYILTCAPHNQELLPCLLANGNSLICDYLVRQKISQASLPVGVLY